MEKSKALVPLRQLDRSIFRLVRRWKLWDFPIPLAMRFRFKIAFISFDFTLVAGYNSESSNTEVIDVPQLFYEDASRLQTARGPSKGYKEREQLRDALTNLESGKIIRLTPDQDESMRKLKRMVTEAGKDIGKEVRHLEDQGDLLVFFPAPKPEGAAPRGRPRKKTEENGSEG